MQIAPEQSLRRARGLSLFGIGALAAIFAGTFGLFPFVRTIELKTYDWRVSATARPLAPAENIVLVWIDNDSIRRMEPLVGRWPWPRLVHATAIDYLSAAGAKVIAYDILFPERDRRKFMVGDVEWTGEESDAALVESTEKAGNVVHAAEASSVELSDPSRAIAENLDAPALNVRIPSPGCVQVRCGRRFQRSPGRRAVSAIRSSRSIPTDRCAASRRWCRSASGPSRHSPWRRRWRRARR